MNEIIKAMTERRSCRSFSREPVPQELLEQVLLAGTFAANGRGRQAGKIVVLIDPEVIGELERRNAAIMGAPESHPFYGAPVVLLVLADPEVATAVEDGALVMGNLMLAAHSVGLGSCWIHRARQEFDAPEGKALLRQWGIPERYIGVGHCILGVPTGEYREAAPRKADFIVKP